MAALNAVAELAFFLFFEKRAAGRDAGQRGVGLSF